MTKEELEKKKEESCSKVDASFAPKDWFNAGFDSAVALLLPRLEDAEKTIKQMSDHCLCHRNIKGFDYGEDHKKLGRPRPGARWFTPTIIAEMFLEKKND